MLVIIHATRSSAINAYAYSRSIEPICRDKQADGIIFFYLLILINPKKAFKKYTAQLSVFSGHRHKTITGGSNGKITPFLLGLLYKPFLVAASLRALSHAFTSLWTHSAGALPATIFTMILGMLPLIST